MLDQVRQACRGTIDMSGGRDLAFVECNHKFLSWYIQEMLCREKPR